MFPGFADCRNHLPPWPQGDPSRLGIYRYDDGDSAPNCQRWKATGLADRRYGRPTDPTICQLARFGALRRRTYDWKDDPRIKLDLIHAEAAPAERIVHVRMRDESHHDGAVTRYAKRSPDSSPYGSPQVPFNDVASESPGAAPEAKRPRSASSPSVDSQGFFAVNRGPSSVHGADSQAVALHRTCDSMQATVSREHDTMGVDCFPEAASTDDGVPTSTPPYFADSITDPPPPLSLAPALTLDLSETVYRP